MLESLGLGLVMRDLQDGALFGLVQREVVDEQRQTRRTAPETGLDDKPVAEDRSRNRLEWVQHGLGLLPGMQFEFGLVEVGKESCNVGRAVHAGIGMGRPHHQLSQRLGDTVEVDRRVQAPTPPDPLLEISHRCRRWLKGEEQVGEGAEAVDIEGHSIGLVGKVDLGGEVDPCLLRRHVCDMARALEQGRLRSSSASLGAGGLAPGLPVADRRPDLT